MYLKTNLYVANKSCLTGNQDSPDEHLKNITDPAYTDLLSSSLIRRNSRFIKNSLYCAMKCLEGNEKPVNGIIIGTGSGNIGSTEEFLKTFTSDKKNSVSPQVFLQSMSSILSGQLSILLKCLNYNMTYVNGEISFENVLTDAALSCREQDGTFLVGSSDQVTEEYGSAILRENYYRNTCASRVINEGICFFLLSGSEGKESKPKISDLEILRSRSQKDSITCLAENFLDKSSVQREDIDLIIVSDTVSVSPGLFGNIPILNFEEVCGRYQTNTSFAVWLGVGILSGEERNGISVLNFRNVSTILIIRNFQDYITFILLKK